MGTGEEALPQYDRVIFQSSALALCLVQVKFPALPRFNDSRFMAPLREVLQEEYPLAENAKAMNIVVTPQGVRQTPGGTLLRFASIDRRWVVEFTEEAISLETRSYTEVGEFAKRFTAILDAVATHAKPRHQLRFGLRYVNEFRHPRGDSYAGWQQLLNPDLLGVDASQLIGGTIQQTVNELRLQRTDGMVLLRHGFLSGTTVAPAPGKREAKNGPFYLLDLDYFDESPGTFNHDPGERMRGYNDVLYRIFRWSIGEDELYRHLKGEL